MKYIAEYWYVPIMVLLILTGIIFTIKLKGIQFRKLGKGLKLMFSTNNEGEGEITTFQALCVTISATIGTGNIIGVSTSLAIGGAGSLLWMFVFALFGLATKYVEGFLAIKYRNFDKNGEVIGGPFAYIEYGMGKKYKPLAKLFAICAAVCAVTGMGTMTQSNGIVDTIDIVFKPTIYYTIFDKEVSLLAIIVGAVITILSGIILFGGLKRISKVCENIIPLFAVIYITCCLLIIVLNIAKLPSAFLEIIKMAFSSKSAAGGIVGYTVLKAITNGAQKGIFANEAGLGSTPIALATAKTKSPTDQGLISMAAMAVTMIICLLTGLAVVVTGVWSQGFEGVYITNEAFKAGLPFEGKFTSTVLMVCICVFAFTSMIGWCVYGQKSMNYLTNNNKTFEKLYLIVYIISIFFGAILKVDLIWNMADLFNGLMAIPNLIALICLSKAVSKETIEELQI